MSNYSATVNLSNGTLAVTRPQPAPQAVDEVIDSLIYTVRDTQGITGIGITIATADEATPLPTVPDPADGAHADPTTAAVVAPDEPTPDTATADPAAIPQQATDPLSS